MHLFTFQYYQFPDTASGKACTVDVILSHTTLEVLRIGQNYFESVYEVFENYMILDARLSKP
jgi:hypothetical protein